MAITLTATVQAYGGFDYRQLAEVLGDRALVGELHTHTHQGATADQIVGAVMHEVRVASRGGKYRMAR